MKRPEKISKLAFYLMDKEPIFYLFIINTDFIHEENINSDYAAVGFKNGRPQFYYTEKLLELDMHYLYFVIIHEAFHIFKKHLEIYKDIFEKDPMTVNIAADCIINTEISETNFNGFSPICMNNAWFIPEDYKSEFYDLGKDAYVTNKLYHWLKQKGKELTKKDTLKRAGKCKSLDTGEYYKVDEYDALDEEHVRTRKYDSKESMLQGKEPGYENPANTFHVDDVIPVFTGGGRRNSAISTSDIPYNDYEAYIFSDDHSKFNENKAENEDEGQDFSSVSSKIFTEKILKQAEQMEKTIKRTSGNSSNEDVLSRLKEILKPKFNWRTILRKYVNLFKSNASIKKKKVKSIITWLMNAKSVNGMIFKHDMKVKNNLQKYIIIGIDTSGSCFYSQEELENFFTEIDGISKEFTFSKEGRVFTFQWGSYIAESIKEYEKDDWKNVPIFCGGGTTPKVIFDMMTENFKKSGEGYIGKLGEQTIYAPNKKTLPLLIILTDGYFFSKLKKEDLGIYEHNTDNILFITRETKDLYDGANFLKWENI